MNIPQQEISKAMKNAKSYSQFKENLTNAGYNVPMSTYKKPMMMKGWVRRLRYELKKSNIVGSHPTSHELRNMEYYERLERLGHPDPLILFAEQFRI